MQPPADQYEGQQARRADQKCLRQLPKNVPMQEGNRETVQWRTLMSKSCNVTARCHAGKKQDLRRRNAGLFGLMCRIPRWCAA